VTRKGAYKCDGCKAEARRRGRERAAERKRELKRDPEWRRADTARRVAAQREARRRARENRRRAEAGLPPLPAPGDGPRIPRRLPAAPLLPFIEAAIRREAGPGAVPEDGHEGRVCERAGIGMKTLYEWRRGARPALYSATADAVLTGLGLCWWEVWSAERAGEAGHRLARLAFEGA
jgi:hypothetical protein